MRRILRHELTPVSLALTLCCGTNVALAGPPLIADDPHTVGPGVAQPIFAISTWNWKGQTLVRGPILDATIGLIDSLDVTLVASLISEHADETGSRWQFAGTLTPGIKWEFFRTERGSLCASPAFFVSSIAPGSPFILLPLQGELTVGDGDAAVGFDVGYVPIFHGDDEWFVAVYGQSAVTKRLKLYGEVWSFGSVPAHTADLGLSVGASYQLLGEELELIGAVSPGLVSFGGPRLNVRVYLGFQYTFERPRQRRDLLQTSNQTAR
jgi:hypothetical protein